VLFPYDRRADGSTYAERTYSTSHIVHILEYKNVLGHASRSTESHPLNQTSTVFPTNKASMLPRKKELDKNIYPTRKNPIPMMMSEKMAIVTNLYVIRVRVRVRVM
jgi:hypothetical protein